MIAVGLNGTRLFTGWKGGDFLLDGLLKFIGSILYSSLVIFDEMVVKCGELLTKDLDKWDFILALSEPLKPFCYTIIAICLLIELAQTAMKVDLLKWEHGLKIAVKMVLSKVCIDTAPKLLKAMYYQGVEWTKAYTAEEFKLAGTINNEMIAWINNLNGWGNIYGIFALALLIGISLLICGLIIMVIAYGRMIEIYVYLAISPIPCAFFPLEDAGGGISRITTKYFKNFAAICLHSVIMIICIHLFGVIVKDAIKDYVKELVKAYNLDVFPQIFSIIKMFFVIVLGAIVLVMSVVKSSSWAKSIFDAQ